MQFQIDYVSVRPIDYLEIEVKESLYISYSLDLLKCLFRIKL